MKTELELIRLTKAIEYLEKANVLMPTEDVCVVDKMIDKYTKEINTYNEVKLEVINPTKKELGIISSSLKKIVFGKYFNPLKKDHKFNYSELYLEHNKDIETLEHFLCECDSCGKEYDRYWDSMKEFYKPYEQLRETIKTSCDNTEIPKDVVDAKILLLRKNRYYNQTKMDYELGENIKGKMLNAYNEQNKDFIAGLKINR